MDENLEENQESDKQLETEKARVLEEAMEELRKERHSQDQVLHMAKRMAQLKGQDPDKGTKSHINHFLYLTDYSYFHTKMSDNMKSFHFKHCAVNCIVFAMSSLVTMEDFQHPDSEDETEEEAVRRVLKQVWDLFLNQVHCNVVCMTLT